MKTEYRVEAIEALCNAAGCKQNLRKVHYKQYVHGQWNPHPSERFLSWWANHKDGDIRAVVAYNSGKYKAEYMEAKEYGIA